MAIDPILLTDPKKFGLLVRDWAFYPANRPATLAKFKEATADCLIVPDRITENPTYPQWTLTNLVVRLPSTDLLKQSEDAQSGSQTPYPLELFYKDIVSGALIGLDALYCRVADYTKSHCG